MTTSDTPDLMTHERIMTGEEYVSYSDYLLLQRERDEALMDRANGDIATMTRNHYERILQERDEVREAFKIVYNERVQMELERNEWKNKAYSHATDYTLMEAKCFRLEQQLKEYDKLKS